MRNDSGQVPGSGNVQVRAREKQKGGSLQVREIAIFGMLGALMYASKIAMDFLPNIHLIGTLITAITIVYRKKALYPIYVFVFLTGFLHGFANWWIPYLYIWTVLWGMVMLIPRRFVEGKTRWSRLRPLVYMCVCAAHGCLSGTLYAPVQALMFGLSFEGMIAWIIAGIPFDITHGVSNFWCGLLIMPIVAALRTAERSAQ